MGAAFAASVRQRLLAKYRNAALANMAQTAPKAASKQSIGKKLLLMCHRHRIINTRVKIRRGRGECALAVMIHSVKVR